MTEDRRSIFRSYMRRMNPIEDPAIPVSDGRYVSHPHQTGGRIADRLDIDPTSTHLLVGGVGSGKSTELRIAQKRLAEVPNYFPLIVDVPSLEKLDSPRAGMLVAAAARVALRIVPARVAPKPLQSARKTLKQTIIGQYVEEGPYDDYNGEPDPIWVSGMSRPVITDKESRAAANELGELARTLQTQFIFLFDGLDRIRPSDELERAIVNDAGVLSAVGVGLVVVGPQQYRYGRYREMKECFSEFHVHGGTSTTHESGGRFLDLVLSLRAEETFLPSSARKALTYASGGVLRDLISLAQTAGQEAYSAGSDTIGPEHVERATQRFGKARLSGISKEMADRLTKLRPRYGKPLKLNFTPATDVDIELLVHDILVELPGTPTKYIVHPTIDPLIAGLRTSA